MIEDKDKNRDALIEELNMLRREVRVYKSELTDAVKLNDKLTAETTDYIKVRDHHATAMWALAAAICAIGLLLIYNHDIVKQRDAALNSLDRCWSMQLHKDKMMKEMERTIIRYSKRYGYAK